MLEKKSLTVTGDNLELLQNKGPPPYYLSPIRPALFLGSLALKLCLLTCWEDNTGMTKFAQASD